MSQKPLFFKKNLQATIACLHWFYFKNASLHTWAIPFCAASKKTSLAFFEHGCGMSTIVMVGRFIAGGQRACFLSIQTNMGLKKNFNKLSAEKTLDFSKVVVTSCLDNAHFESFRSDVSTLDTYIDNHI